MEKCTDCKQWATIYHPAPFCDAHWANRFSTQNVDGKPVPFRKLFKDNMVKRGLWKKPDESLDEWYANCEKEAKKSKLLS
jgi:hypothetical protein